MLMAMQCMVKAHLLAAAVVVAGCGGDTPGGSDGQALVEVPNAALQQDLSIYAGVDRPDVNVLLISLDSVRRDFVSCYGYQPPHAPDEKTTPNIDAIAGEGVIFDQWYANSSWALPTHVSMLTGQPDIIHGVDLEFFAVHESRPSLASVLKEVGYATAGFYGSPALAPRFGFDRGFDEYRSCYGPKLAEAIIGRTSLQAEIDVAMQAGDTARSTELTQVLRRRDKALTVRSTADRSADFVTDAALAAIERAESAQRPWFVFAHYFDPHHDYDPPAEYGRRFDPEYAGKINGRGYFGNPAVGVYSKDPNLNRRQRIINDRDLDHIKALYAGEIAWTDAQVGRLLDSLRERGVLDDTLVVVTSSHGCEFFEHGGIAEGGSLFEEQLRVPLILRHPGSLPSGVRVSGLASHADLMPTLLEVLGLPAPASLASVSAAGLIDGSQDPSGRSVLARLVQVEKMTVVKGPRVIRHTVREAFLRDDIKVMRWRRWPEPMSGLPLDRLERVEEQAATARQADFLLRWVDLTATPGEAFKDRREDFDADPRASGALAEFARVYEGLLAQPQPVSAAMSRKGLAVARSKPGFEAKIAERQAKHLLGPPGK